MKRKQRGGREREREREIEIWRERCSRSVRPQSLDGDVTVGN